MNIIIQFATEQMLPQLIDLWQQCFGDSEEYIRFFYRHHPPERHTLVLSEQAAPVAMVNLLPLEVVSAAGHAYQGRYIYGVATHPAHRRKGFSKALMAHTHKMLRQQNMALSALVPASADLFTFYGKLGFEAAFYRNVATGRFPAVCAPLSPYECSACSAEDYERLRNQAFSSNPMFVRWSRDALAYRLKEAAMVGGRTLLLQKDGHSAAVLCFPRENHLLIKEFVSVELSLEECLPLLSDIFHKEEYTVHLPANINDADKIPFGMVYSLREHPHTEEHFTAKQLPFINLVLD